MIFKPIETKIDHIEFENFTQIANPRFLQDDDLETYVQSFLDTLDEPCTIKVEFTEPVKLHEVFLRGIIANALYDIEIRGYLDSVLEKTETLTEQSAEEQIIDFDVDLVDYVEIDIYHRGVLPFELKVAQVYFIADEYELPITEPADYRREETHERSSFRKINGGYGFYEKWRKWEFTVEFRYTPEEVKQKLYEIKQFDKILFIPEPVEFPEELFITCWENPFNFRYASAFKGSGYRGTIRMSEV